MRTEGPKLSIRKNNRCCQSSRQLAYNDFAPGRWLWLKWLTWIPDHDSFRWSEYGTIINKCD